MKFSATLELNGKTATGIPVPESVLTGLDGGKRPAVVVTIGGYTYRSTVGVLGGRSMLPVSAAHRAAAGIEAGETVEVELVLDTTPRTVEVPAELAAALAEDVEAKQFFDRLSLSHQRAYTEWVGSAKKAETKANRVTKALQMLREGTTR